MCMRKTQYFFVLWLFLVALTSSWPVYASDTFTTLDNGTIRLTINVTAGGCVWRLVESANPDSASYVRKGSADNDYGSQLQMAISDGHDGILQPPNSWNPTQAGDVYRNPSPVITWYNNGYEIYVQSYMRDWITQPTLTNVVCEMWYRLEGKTVRARGNLINYENHDRWWAGGEFPANFVKSACSIFRYGNSSDPWNVNAATPYTERQWNQVALFTNENPAQDSHTANEFWAGWYTPSGPGLTCHQTDGAATGAHCRSQNSGGGPDNDDFAQMNFSNRANFPAYSVRHFTHAWTIGTVTEARNWNYSWHSNECLIKSTDHLYYAFNGIRADYLAFNRQTGYWDPTGSVFATRAFGDPLEFRTSEATISGRTMQNGTVEADVQITSATGVNSTNYVGLSLRKPTVDGLPTSDGGYMFKLYYDGTLKIYSVPFGQDVISVQTNKPPTTTRRLKVTANGNNFKIYVDGILQYDWNEVFSLYPRDGFIGLSSFAGRATYDNLDIKGATLDTTELHYTNQGNSVHLDMGGSRDTGAKFTAANPFRYVRVQCSGTVGSTMRMRLYNWSTNYGTSINGTALANTVLTSVANPGYLVLDTGSVRPAGSYALRMSDSVATFGPDAFDNSNDTEAEAYAGVSGIRFMADGENLFGNNVTGNIGMSVGTDIAARIMPLNPLSGLGMIFNTQGSAASAPFTLKLYRWYSNYATTIAGSPLQTKSFAQGYSGNSDFWVGWELPVEYDNYGFLVVCHLDTKPTGTGLAWYINGNSTESRAEYYNGGVRGIGDLYLLTMSANTDYKIETYAPSQNGLAQTTSSKSWAAYE